ncbi:Conserved oligomeric Golgi complex subunit 3 [Bagarius yarrelli]|uniref:Conserved oligomeric Golgi complex subunit 3 n=1 Tax=Bagarius yarrelli TaxID=175774 RepID=A0A556VBH7_BAGYA|nr:Conserved oligomeric Golgi complex subunit 3 [Bagarius yarrelli]
MASSEQYLPELADKETREKLALWDRSAEAMARLTDKQTDSILEIRSAAECLPVPTELPIEDVCFLSCRSQLSPFTAAVPASTEDVLMKGFQTLHLENEQIERAQQSELVALAESIQQKLSYFDELENINTKLNSHTLSVNSEGFISMLSKLDNCIEYVSSHPNFKDYPVYLTKFRQCLSKALHLLKTHIINTLKNLTNQLIKRDPAATANTDNAFTLYYVKFRAAAPKLKTLIEQVERRSEKIPEYQQLLDNVHQCYLDQRDVLLAPTIKSTIIELTGQNSKDHCALVRSGCAFMVHVCQDEHQLYNEFFSKSTIRLNELLEKLCMSLYDVLRPLIIHVVHLETLSELCSILKNEMLEDHVHNNIVCVDAVVKQMLEDVQERLVYRTHIYIQTDISGYNPAPGDLAYPDKLQMMEKIAQSLKEEQAKLDNSFSNVQLEESDSRKIEKTGGVSPADLHGMWYPTVRRTLLCLSKLYRCIDRAVFQGLSQEALSACILSLIKASEFISKNKSKIDGQLFLIKHLLIMREQIAPFHADFAIKEISLDLKKTRDAAFKILNPKAVPKFFRLNSHNAILEFLLEGTPEIKEHYIDSKKDVDRHLKSSCEQFIQQQTCMFVGNLEEFLTKVSTSWWFIVHITDISVHVQVSALKAMVVGGGPSYQLSQQPWAQPANINDLVMSTYRVIKSKLPLTLQSMMLYLANKDTEFILFKPVRVHLVQIVDWNDVYCPKCSFWHKIAGIFLPACFGHPIYPQAFLCDDLQVCTQNWTCCNTEMVQNFIERSKHQFEKFIDEATEDLRNTFESRFRRFNDFFLELMEKTHRSLDEMFVRTYGDLYTQNADIFQQLFSRLKHYYINGNVNLDETISDFWTRLMERMFQLLNSQYDINDDYMECMNKHMDDLKPFGDVPKKVKAQMSKAFVVARTFVQGLEFGEKVANNASKVNMSAACVGNLTKMLYCPYCQSVTAKKPCKYYCLQILKLCLWQTLKIDNDWSRYIDAMLLLIERLEGPFNIESVMEPIDVKISDAIMMMQEKTMELSYEVFRGCGQPKLLERSRVSRNVFNIFSSEFTNTEHTSTNLQKLVVDVKWKLSGFKSFWSSLPEFVCQDENVAARADETNCWDAEERGWNISEVLTEEFIDFSAMVSALKQAYNGYQLHEDDSSDEISGSGSGSGCIESCVSSLPPLFTETPETEGSSSSHLPSCNLFLLLLLVLSIITSLEQQR